MTLQPGEERTCAEFADALVAVLRGAIVLEGFAGTRARFGAGSLLALDPRVLRVLRNDGPEPAVLCTTCRPSAS